MDDIIPTVRKVGHRLYQLVFPGGMEEESFEIIQEAVEACVEDNHPKYIDTRISVEDGSMTITANIFHLEDLLNCIWNDLPDDSGPYYEDWESAREALDEEWIRYNLWVNNMHLLIAKVRAIAKLYILILKIQRKFKEDQWKPNGPLQKKLTSTTKVGVDDA